MDVPVSRLSVSGLSVFAVLLVFCSDGSAQVGDRADGGVVDYATQIKPLLKRRCAACHGGLRQEAGLRLDASQLIRQGSDSGPVVIPGEPDRSPIIQRVTDEVARMPPDGEGTPLTDEEVGLLTDWIAQGAVAPESEEFLADPQEHWSYQPVRRPSVPTVSNKPWVDNPIDAFVAARHEELGLVPQPTADRATLLRRVFLDLIGVPPTQDQLHAFLSDRSPDAYPRVVNRLLNSPLYGQRWGRHWMDVWRYSDWYGSRGINEIRYSQRHIWRWRDWIIDSLNADKGYDRMILEMLAGDELSPSDPAALAATGFLGRNWYKFDRNVWMRSLVEHTATGFLAVSLKCARCHDHKFDPISQQEYYRFRAFFEPHDFRTDRVAAETGYEKDATLGMVLKDGIARVYDRHVDAPTYLFERGDDRYPDTAHPLEPGVIAVLGNTHLQIEPIALPRESYFPALRPDLVNGMQQLAAEKIAARRRDVSVQVARIADIEQRITAAGSGEARRVEAAPREVFLDDEFLDESSDRWKRLNGTWEFRGGRLVESEVGSFLTIVTRGDHPRDFRARVRYTHRPEGAIHSVGIAFDVRDRESWQAIYTYANDGNSGIQAFHREQGREIYPQAGIVPTAVEIGVPLTGEIAVRDQQLNVWLNGELKIVYTLPLERRPGGFALWTHSGAAEFEDLRIETLPETFALATTVNTPRNSPFTVPTVDDLQAELNVARAQLAQAEGEVEIAEAEREAFAARLSAERARVESAGNSEERARLASAAEAAVACKQAEAALARLEAEAAPDKQKLAAARAALEQARSALANPDTAYTPLGDVYPRHSTGRRLALARWIADAGNPRTARVAVNHIWERHFGRGLVPSLAEFGIRARPRSHPELLDWLASELTRHDWSMKHIHRLILTSRTYRMTTTAQDCAPQNLDRDPENVYLWRMNSQRMEAEVVRDSLLHLAGTLDLQHGGPALDEMQGQTIPRRSVYFRITPNETMEFLELFDLANPDECYERKESIVPQQSLALLNSRLALTQARHLARALSAAIGESTSEADANRRFVEAAFEQVLGRQPTRLERARCMRFLNQHPQRFAADTVGPSFPAAPAGNTAGVAPAADPHLRARENLVHVLFSHNDFVTIR